MGAIRVTEGSKCPFFTEVWTSPRHAEPFATRDEACRHTLSNPGFAPFHFLWKLHPALAVTSQHRIDFRAMKPGTGVSRNAGWSGREAEGVCAEGLEPAEIECYPRRG
jgi:hypothetical protein